MRQPLPLCLTGKELTLVVSYRPANKTRLYNCTVLAGDHKTQQGDAIKLKKKQSSVQYAISL